jgi:hypothetical protein
MSPGSRLAAARRLLFALATVLLVITAIDLAARLVPRPAGSGDTPVVSPADVTISAPGLDATVLWAVGDVADCGSGGDEATASLVQGSAGLIALLGDLAYDSGTKREFDDCFDPSWGNLEGRIRPTPGNHEYKSVGAAPYFAYFGALAGEPARGYYSYDFGAWHVIVLNSNCAAVGGCGQDSPLLAWLAEDLARSEASCMLAYWHHPVFSSGQHGNDGRMRPAYELLDAAGVDVVLAGHDHDYERFAPQDASGRATVDGVRQFVVGTGGKSLRGFAKVRANSEVRYSREFGVLRLVLDPSSYSWEFITVAGQAIDSGTDACR